MKDRTLLMIPGPVEFEPDVLQAFGASTNSHVAPGFIEIFGKALQKMREVWLCPSGQPFIMAGSGTLAMDVAGANLIEPGDKALVISTGYFGDRYSDLLQRYGAEVKCLSASVGDIVSPEEIENELKTNNYKLLTFTHVDTSSAVLVDPVPIGKLGKKYGVITVLDGVCSVAGEEIRQEEWGIDVVLTASQKAIGVPPGLALLMVSDNVINNWNRRSPVRNYYADWNNWLPVMKAYEEGKPSYFGTPPVNHICALYTSLCHILDEGMQKRFERHKKTGLAVRKAIRAIGLEQLPANMDISANTLTAPYYPDGITGQKLITEIQKAGVIVAGGLHPENRDKYFRIGHMGSVNKADILATIGAIETGLKKCGYNFETGIGVSTIQDIL